MRLKILLFLLVGSLLISLIAAEFEVLDYEIDGNYGIESSISGWMEASFTNISVDSLLKAFNTNISLKDFLDTQISNDSLKGDNGNTVQVYIGKENRDTWQFPSISVYMESETLNRFEIGSNLRQDEQLIIIDIYATNEGERLDLAKWLIDTINNGWTYYTYSYNVSSPESPTKVAGGLVNINFNSNGRVTLIQNVSEIDAHRHRVSLTVWISGA